VKQKERGRGWIGGGFENVVIGEDSHGVRAREACGGATKAKERGPGGRASAPVRSVGGVCDALEPGSEVTMAEPRLDSTLA
jgi:hypothetical protein